MRSWSRSTTACSTSSAPPGPRPGRCRARPPSQVSAAGTQHGRVIDDRRRARILYVESLGNAALNRRRIEAGHDLSAFLQEDARARRRAAPEGDAIGALSGDALVGGISEVLTAWVEGRIRPP